jgi:hypothetical protein
VPLVGHDVSTAVIQAPLFRVPAPRKPLNWRGLCRWTNCHPFRRRRSFLVEICFAGNGLQTNCLWVTGAMLPTPCGLAADMDCHSSPALKRATHQVFASSAGKRSNSSAVSTAVLTARPQLLQAAVCQLTAVGTIFAAWIVAGE